MPTIEVDDDVWQWLKEHARPLEDTANTVLRRIAGLDGSGGAMALVLKSVPTRPSGRRGMKVPQRDYRNPILRIIVKHKGEADRNQVLQELERAMASRLTEFDRREIASGTIRWQKSAEWEVSTMRQEGLLKAQSESRRGVWSLTAKGAQVAQALTPE